MDHPLSKIHSNVAKPLIFFRLRRAVNPNPAPTRTFVRPLDPEPAPGGNLITTPAPQHLKISNKSNPPAAPALCGQSPCPLSSVGAAAALGPGLYRSHHSRYLTPVKCRKERYGIKNPMLQTRIRICASLGRIRICIWSPRGFGTRSASKRTRYDPNPQQNFADP